MSVIEDVLAAATSQIGVPYLFAHEQPGIAFDCSGLSQYAYGAAGVSLPRTAAQQQQATTRVSTPLPGDLVFYGSPAHHVGIYIGAGKMIDAPDVGKQVRIEGVGSPTNYGRVSGAGTLAAVPVAFLTGAGDAAAGWLSGARAVLLEGAAVALALALIGYGLYRAVAGGRKPAD